MERYKEYFEKHKKIDENENDQIDTKITGEKEINNIKLVLLGKLI